MSSLHYHHNQLYIEDTPLADIAKTHGTPVYVYSKAALLKHYHDYNDAFQALPHRVCYAVKANSNLSILKLLAQAGAGFDVVSIGELHRVLQAGGLAEKCVFSGVGKTEAELTTAISLNIGTIDIESLPEFERLARIAQALEKNVNVAIRVNPNINANTHAHISTGLESNKFGIETEAVLALAQRIQAHPYVTLTGLAAHIGSQITELTPLLQSADHLLALAQTLKNHGMDLQHINLGGGLGITYHQESPPSLNAYAQAIFTRFQHMPYQLILEPGRAIVGPIGCLLTRIEYIKQTPQKNFALVDAGMNDLIRPALYEAWQLILPVSKKNIPPQQYDIAGPVCESADFLGKDRQLAIEPGDLLAIDGAGAYGFSMSSNYNTRCRPAEILIDGSRSQVIRPRETLNDLFGNEIQCMESTDGF